MLLFITLTLTSFALLTLLTLLSLLLSQTYQSLSTTQQSTTYECGFDTHSLSRVPLSIRYFALTILFLLFDIEIILLIFSPSELPLSLNNPLFTLISLSFILILYLGLLYEYSSGALNWTL